MTVSAQTPVNSSTANGVTTVFPYQFKILRDADLEVLVDGVVKTLSTHYTVSGAGNNSGGDVTFVTAPAADAIVVRRRNMQLVRTTDYQYQGDLPNMVLNPDLDAPILMAQQLQEQVSRAARGPAGETWAELPAAADRLDKMLAFDATTGAPELSTFTATEVASAVAAAYAAGSTADAVTYLPSGTGAVATSVQAKLRQIVSAWDFMTSAQITDCSARTGALDVTAAVQAAIDSLTNGGRVVFPPGVYDVTGLRIDGTSGTLTNVTLEGYGPASEIRIHAGNTSNVIKAAAGSGFRITGLRIRGGLGRSVTAVAAPSRGLWVTGTSYTAGDTAEVSSSDAATTSVLAGNLVYQCTSNHVAGATFAGDKASKWTTSAVANLNTVDISYGTRNNIYLDGVVNASVDNCELLDSVYAGINPGTGPVQTANAGTGSSYIKIQNNHFYNCTNGVASGKTTYSSIDGNTLRSCITYGIVIDDPTSSGNAVTNNTVTGAGSHGIYLYGADTSTVSGNAVSFCSGVGILLESAAVGNPIVGNICNNNLQGIRAYNSTVSSVAGNTCRANTQYGIFVEVASQVGMAGNTCESNGYDGIRLTTCSGFSLSGNVCSTNDGEGGLYLTGCSNGSISGGTYLNNNDAAVPSSTGAGIRLIDSTAITISGVSAYDSRGGGSKTQKYGINATGTSDTILLGLNSLAGNATGTFLLSGTANRVAPDFADFTNAATPASFTADKYLTFVDSDGTTVYIPARLGSW